jgi:heavy metal efflux system protein
MSQIILQAAKRRPMLVVFISLCVAALGVWAFCQLKVEAYPDISDLQVTVITLQPGQAPEEVEQQVTVPIERALNSVPGVISRRSRTIFGLSVVDLTFDYNVDENVARQTVLERLKDAELPKGAEPSLAPPTTPAGELYRYVLRGKGMNAVQLRELQDWVVSPRFIQVPGVGDAFPFGGLIKEYQIAVNPMAVYKYGLSIQQIAHAVEQNNQNAGGSLLRSGQQALMVRGVGQIRSIPDIENVVVSSKNGTPVFVRDVARVSLGSAPPAGIFGMNNESGLVEGVVVMRRGENPSEVLKGVREVVEDLNRSPLMHGAHLEPLYDRTDLVANTLHTVSKTLAEALAIVLLVLLFFFGSLRGALLTALVIPFSLLFAFLCMHLAGINASLLSLGALDFGVIVDGTLVMVECIMRKLALEDFGKSGRERVDVILEAAAEMRKPIFFSLLIVISAYMPLFLLERVERRLFMPMAFTISSALLGSLILCLTLVPVLAMYFFPEGMKPWENPIVTGLIRGYEGVVRVLLARPGATVAATSVLVAAGFALGGNMGTEFLPQLDEGVLWIRSNLPPGISLEKSAEVASQIRQALKESPEIDTVTSQTGRQESNTEPFGPNRNEFLVTVNPYNTWRPGLGKAGLVQEISERLRARIPGATFNFTQPIIDMVMESVTGSSADLAVILRGPDLALLRERAAHVSGILRSIPGSADTALEQEEDQPQLRIEVDRGEVARYGINVADIQEVIEMAIGGKPVSAMFEGDRRFDIVIRYTPEARSSLEGIGNILVPAVGSARVPLSKLAQIQIRYGASIVARRENERQISVRTNIRGRDQGGFVDEAQRRVRSEVHLPAGYKVEWGGQFENLTRARRRLQWVLPLTIGLIFGILYWSFGSTLKALLVLTAVPFSIVGGVAALYIRGIPFSVSAAVGFVSLFGVAVMSGVLYVAEIQRQLDRGLPLKEAILTGSRVQFRPRCTLVVVAMLGIAPAAFAQGIGSDVQRPLATVVLGGLISTLVLTLLAMPCLCYLAERYFPNGDAGK